MTESSSKPGRRFNFSLRALLAVVIIAAVLCYTVPIAVRKCEAWQRDREIQELIRLIETTIVPTTTELRDEPDSSPPAAREADED